MKEYRIACAQVRSTDPLVVRTRTGTGTTVAVDGGSATPLKGDGDVRLVIDAGAGTPSAPVLPPESDDFSPNSVQLVFQGKAEARVEKEYLVVESEGLLWVTCGADVLPFSENRLREAQSVAFGLGTNRPPPHQPV